MKKAGLFLFATLMVVSLFFVSCGNDPFFHQVKVTVDDKIIDSQLIYDSESYTFPKAPEKDGFEFLYWAEGDNSREAEKYDAEQTIKVTRDISVKAVWQAQWEITYVANNGTTATLVDYVNKGDQIKLKATDAFTKEGYVIDGWYSDKEGTTYFQNAETFATPEEDLTLYAHWVSSDLIYTEQLSSEPSIYYSVKQKSALSNAPEISTIYRGKSVTTIENDAFKGSSFTSITIPATITTIGSKVFDGNTKLTTLTVPSTVTSLQPDSFSGSSLTNITIKVKEDEKPANYPYGTTSAKFTWTPYKITFNANGATGTKAAQEFQKSDAVTFDNATGLTLSGYKFDHWNSKADGSGDIYEVADDKTYSLTGDITVYAIWLDENLEFVTSPYKYSVKIKADADKSKVTKVDIPSKYRGEEVRCIAPSAFADCTALKQVTIPDTITTIDNSAFKGCTSLESLTIPEGVSALGGALFSGCTALKSVTIAGTLPSTDTLYDSFFEGCTSLESFTIPAGVKSIKENVFKGCTSLKKLTIPEGVTSIATTAFSGTSTEITVENYQDEISGAPWGSSGKVTWSKGLKPYTVKYDKNSEDATGTIADQLTKANEKLSDGTGFKQDHSLVVKWNTKADGSGTDYALSADCSTVTGNITLYAVWEDVFSYTGTAIALKSQFKEKVTEIKIPETVTEISADCFKGCSNLKTLFVPISVTKIGSGAFANIASDAAVTIDAVKGTIPEASSSETNWGLPSTATITWTGKVKITVKYYKGTAIVNTETIVPSPSSALWDGKQKDGTSIVPTGYVLDGWYTEDNGEGTYYANASTLTADISLYAHFVDADLSFVLNEDKTYKVNKAKREISVVTIPAVYHGEKVTTIGIFNYSNVESVEFEKPENITAIEGEKGSFIYTKLSTIDLSKTKITEFEDEAFSSCNYLTSITLPNSLTSIGSRVFAYSTILTTITIPNSITTIASDAFESSEIATINIDKSKSEASDELKNGSPWGAATGTTVNWSPDVGDNGQAGGIIFYVNPNYVAGSTDEATSWKYLEAAPNNLPGTYTWGNPGDLGTKYGIGTGKSNTEKLLEAKKADSSLSFPAAEACDAYTAGGYTDWFLPSKDELNLMYENLHKKGLGNFGDNEFWSSSELYTVLVWTQRFSDGEPDDRQASWQDFYVRPVRYY